MKIASGCFGCLAVVFLVLAFLSAILVSVLMPMIATMVPDAAPYAAQAEQVFRAGSGFCCCLSASLAVVLGVAGAMRKKDPIE